MIGLPAGILAAVKRNTVWDYSVMGASLTGYSMPIFWWGLLLILTFSVGLGWTPVSGRIAIQYDIPPVTGFMLIDSLLSGDKGAFRSALSHLVLPAIALGTIPLAVIARMTRSSMLEVLREDYVRTARAKGASPLRVVGVHALRNALIPVVTTIGLQVGTLLAGAILTETIFSWPGIGKWLVEAIHRRDYPAVQGGILLSATSSSRVNLVVDLLYGVINPRIRHAMSADPSADRRGAAPRGAAVAAGRAVARLPPQPRRAGRPRRRRRCCVAVRAVRRRHRAVRAERAVPRRDPAAAVAASRSAATCFLLGTDPVGRDMLSRLIHGTRLSLADRPGLGRPVAGRRRAARPARRLLPRRASSITIMRLMDVMLALPSLLLAVAVVAILGPGPGQRDVRDRDRRCCRTSCA